MAQVLLISFGLAQTVSAMYKQFIESAQYQLCAAKEVVSYHILKQAPGTFAVRTAPQSPRSAVVLCINDNNKVCC